MGGGAAGPEGGYRRPGTDSSSSRSCSPLRLRAITNSTEAGEPRSVGNARGPRRLHRGSDPFAGGGLVTECGDCLRRAISCAAGRSDPLVRRVPRRSHDRSASCIEIFEGMHGFVTNVTLDRDHPVPSGRSSRLSVVMQVCGVNERGEVGPWDRVELSWPARYAAPPRRQARGPAPGRRRRPQRVQPPPSRCPGSPAPRTAPRGS